MSITLGQSENYINKIENGKFSPSMTAFFDICDYLGISPKDFFDTENNHPELVNEVVTVYKRLDNIDQTSIANIINSLARDKS